MRLVWMLLDVYAPDWCVTEIEHPADFTCVDISPNDAYFLTGCRNGIVRKWSSAIPYDMMGEYEGIGCYVTAFINNERFLSKGGELLLYHLTSNYDVLPCQYQPGSMFMRVTPMTTYTFLVGLSDTNVQLWSSESKVCVKTFQGHMSYVTSISKVDDSHLISGSNDNTAKLWKMHSNGCLSTFKGHTAYVRSVVYKKREEL
jgi:WD40 repeat protein